MLNLTYKIYTLGCKVNQYDSFDLSRKLNAIGFKLVNKNADIAIINTCCVTQIAIHKSKRMVNKARGESPQAKIVVIGCWPQVYKKEVKNIGADIIWGVGKYKELIKRIKLSFKFHGILSSRKKRDSRMTGEKIFWDKSRYFLKIQDGCEQFCSYCIIPYARGKLKSRPAKKVLAEIKQAIRAKYREIVLCGIHLGMYFTPLSAPACPPAQTGADRQAGNPSSKIGKGNLVGLLKKLIKIENLGRIRLSSIEVTEVSDELIKLIAKSDKICRHLPIPLQSGSNKILKLMNRPYNIKYFRNKVKKIRKIMPDMAITTDIMVGFPGETKKDFQDTFNLAKEMQFSRLHVFPFSEHKKTLATKLPDKVKKQEIEQRGQKLRDLGEKLAKKYQKKFRGRILDIVVESKTGNKYKGKTEYYFDVEFNKEDIVSGKPLIGNIVKIKFEKNFHLDRLNKL
jgi:threonylcarbamoyladenosine tRNA methylthiotransferase MtaB